MYFFHSDYLGSTTFLTDASGQPYQFLLYLPWGENFIEQKTAPFSTPYQFNGKELDSETELYNYGARYYDPSLSVWLGVDPMADKFNGLSPYNYANNNPVVYKDPDGKNPILGAILGAFMEYASKIGVKIVYEGKSFSEANSALDLHVDIMEFSFGKDLIDISLEAGLGAISGAIDGNITKFAKFLAKKSNRAVVEVLVEKGFEALLSVLETGLKSVISDSENFDIQAVLVEALVDVGLGHLFQVNKFKDAAKDSRKKANKIDEYVEELVDRKRNNKPVVKANKSKSKAKKQVANIFDVSGSLMGLIPQVISNKAGDDMKEINNDKEIRP